ncbi:MULTISPECIES: Uma2 family endonuclease [unclassified Amycolatopsis]|uniref:Uma2 family endonuclease n=1 Tax=unclassified Amycolatopsis TaxID=2618356 RepID=UPI002876F49A|nr:MULTISPECIES: Uma2 family endonuclease [unclassified Amycolatopsis]MDS0133332.1 Uma2 family endonuclease [Amycolatopsis sp. 505]MDS0146562.1 Uma2 family endonuclease [Amycolatopsis sp. CM201R]
MIALPKPGADRRWEIPDHLLTIEEYAALGETDTGFTELVEGRVLMSPSLVADHNIAVFELGQQLAPQVPSHLRVLPETDVNLGLAPPGKPGFSRRPDLLIVERAAIARVRQDSAMLRAEDVAVVIEIVSPGSERTDYHVKHDEYADAGIPHYWIIDMSEPISLVACHQAGEFGYMDAAAVTGTFATEVPFPVKLDLTALLG